MDKYFDDDDLLDKPTIIQQAIVRNHEDVGEYTDTLYLKDGITVLFECADGYVACVPKIKPSSLN